MTVVAVLASLVPILWESGIGSDVMKPIAAPIVGGMITSTIHVLILVPVFFVMMKERSFEKEDFRPALRLKVPLCQTSSATAVISAPRRTTCASTQSHSP